MMDVRPIETRYHGYRFRSRLEARWAVFFDTLGVRWEYEVEGFELPSGRYLPDFWLPREHLWVEIKPDWELFMHDDRTWSIAQELASVSSRVMVLVGTVAPGRCQAVLFDDSGRHQPVTHLARCRRCESLNWVNTTRRQRLGWDTWGNECFQSVDLTEAHP